MKYKWHLKKSPYPTGSGQAAELELLVKVSQLWVSLPDSAFRDTIFRESLKSSKRVSVEIGKCCNSGNVKHLPAQHWAGATANSSRDGRGCTGIQSWDKANENPSSLSSLFY